MAVTTVRPAPPQPAAAWMRQVRLARTLLKWLLILLVAAGILAALLGYQAVRTALDNYYQIVQAGAVSADAAQDAREALLVFHSAVADYLTLPVEERAAREAEAAAAWDRYQEAMRRSWANLSDETFGEIAVFDAADTASWTYNRETGAMFAFAAASENEAAVEAFRAANTTLVRRLIPALTGLEQVKLESMEEAYARTSDQIRAWTTFFALFATAAVAILVAAFVLTRFWLHYRWTWQLVVGLVVGALLFVWFLVSLLSAASQVRVMVRDAYDTVSGVQAIEALLTQADALESLALLDPAEAGSTLRDYDQYIFLIEQQLCGDRDCWRSPFLRDSVAGSGPEIAKVNPVMVETALAGQSKYGLPRTPLIANVHFEGEAEALESVRGGLQEYLQANLLLRRALDEGDLTLANRINRTTSAEALDLVLEATDREHQLVRAEFERIWDTVRGQMRLNLWLTLLFVGVAALGAWGLSQRRQSLFP